MHHTSGATVGEGLEDLLLGGAAVAAKYLPGRLFVLDVSHVFARTRIMLGSGMCGMDMH